MQQLHHSSSLPAWSACSLHAVHCLIAASHQVSEASWLQELQFTGYGAMAPSHPTHQI